MVSERVSDLLKVNLLKVYTSSPQEQVLGIWVLFFFFFFVVLGLELRAYTSSHSTSNFL
jgi:hypothetical protein